MFYIYIEILRHFLTLLWFQTRITQCQSEICDDDQDEQPFCWDFISCCYSSTKWNPRKFNSSTKWFVTYLWTNCYANCWILKRFRNEVMKLNVERIHFDLIERIKVFMTSPSVCLDVCILKCCLILLAISWIHFEYPELCTKQNVIKLKWLNEFQSGFCTFVPDHSLKQSLNIFFFWRGTDSILTLQMQECFHIFRTEEL